MSQIRRLDEVNQKLQSFNWALLHPYSQGGDIGVIERILRNHEDPGQEILKFFGKKFFQLRPTLHIVEGFLKDRPYLKDHGSTIERSFLLCLQKEFSGAINLLIPVIEGTLRKASETTKGEIDMNRLVKALDKLRDKYLILERAYLRNRVSHVIGDADVYFDVNQEKQLIAKYREYFDLWTEQFKRFVQNSLYADTRSQESTDSLNRHLIFHALADNIEYTFGNYLRLFHCLSFLSWAIGSAHDECSVLSNADEALIQNKWVDCMQILAASEALSDVKSHFLGEQMTSFKDYLSENYRQVLKRPEHDMKSALSILDETRPKQRRGFFRKK